MTEANETLTYSGLLSFHSYGEADDILFLSSESDPFVDVLEDAISGKVVNVRYWITDKPVSKDEAQEEFMRQAMGDTIVRFGANYSEITGYLYTDEDLWIGGHDLAEELRSNVGKWLILEIDVQADGTLERFINGV